MASGRYARARDTLKLVTNFKRSIRRISRGPFVPDIPALPRKQGTDPTIA